jgi:hypothetical protein
MAKKLYEESNIAAIAEKIRSRTGGDKKYTVAKMADGVDDAAEAAAEEKEAITRGLIERDLTEIVIPKGVKEIGPYALAGLSKCGIYDFSNFDSVPPLSYEGTWGGIYGKIFVPYMLREEWMSATNWSSLWEQIVGVHDPIETSTPEHVSEGLEIYQSDNWDASEDEYEVFGRGSCTDSVVVVPEYYQGKKVVAIAGSVFDNDETIVEIYLPGSIKTIDQNPFYECVNLKKIYLMGVRELYSFAFSSLGGLEYVKFGAGFDFCGVGAFSGAYGAVFDFSDCEYVPSVMVDEWAPDPFGTNPLILVPMKLYSEWINSTNWTLLSPYIAVVK